MLLIVLGIIVLWYLVFIACFVRCFVVCLLVCLVSLVFVVCLLTCGCYTWALFAVRMERLGFGFVGRCLI